MSDTGGDLPATHDELLALARDAAAQITAWQARLVETIEALITTGCADPWRPYLAWALGMTPSEAGEVVELVDRLTELPRTRAVMASGERSLRTVLAIARRATPETEAMILESTEAFTGAQLERTLREYARIIAPSKRIDDGDVEDDLDPDPSSAKWGWRDGRFHLDADFDAVDGAALQAWLEAERDRLPEVAGESTMIPARQRTCAEALLALGERAIGARANDVGFVPDSVAVNLVIHARESDEGLTVDRAFIPGVGPVPQWSLGMLMERGTLTTTVMVNGEPIMATRPIRYADAEQRRQLLARDGGCAYPGCSATLRLIAHHIRFYDDGGPTQLRNMVLLCRRHHRLVHRHGLRITPDTESPPDRLVWRFSAADGRALDPRSPVRSMRRRLRTAERRRGSGDRLTEFGLDVTLAHWLRAVERERAERQPVAA